jgi:alpha-L-fucosidase
MMVGLLSVFAPTMNAQDYKVPVLENDEPMATGQFTPDWESLRTYEVPDWFRDAKFGIWAHWGPQCAHMPNFASRNHSGVACWRSDSHVG